MIIVAAKSSEDDYVHFTFEEHRQEENEKTIVEIKIKNTIKNGNKVLSHDLESVNLKRYIESVVRTRTVYLPKKLERELFYKCADFLVKAQELPVNVKNVMYPGSTMTLLEYGTLALSNSEIEVFFRAVLDGVTSRKTSLEPLEEEEEEPTSIEEILGVNETVDEAFPFGGVKADFVDEEEEQDFDIGEVTKEDD